MMNNKWWWWVVWETRPRPTQVIRDAKCNHLALKTAGWVQCTTKRGREAVAVQCSSNNGIVCRRASLYVKWRRTAMMAQLWKRRTTSYLLNWFVSCLQRCPLFTTDIEQTVRVLVVLVRWKDKAVRYTAHTRILTIQRKEKSKKKERSRLLELFCLPSAKICLLELLFLLLFL